MILEKAITAFRDYLEAKERSKHTVKGYCIMLFEFNRYIESKLNGLIYVDEVTLEQMEDYLAYRKHQGDKPVSRNSALYIFRSFFNFLVRRDLIDKNLSLKLEPIKAQQQERLSLLASEVEELLEAIEHPLIRIAVITLANTGIRVSELCSLKRKDIDLEARLLKVIAGKGNKDRTIPINDKLEIVLRKYLLEQEPKNESERFFATKKTGKLSPIYINFHLQRTTEKLGWKKSVTAHILRHSFASNLVRKNASLPAIQALLGHSDLRVTSRYIHQNLTDLKDTVNLI